MTQKITQRKSNKAETPNTKKFWTNPKFKQSHSFYKARIRKQIQKTKQTPRKFWTNPEVEQSQSLTQT